MFAVSESFSKNSSGGSASGLPKLKSNTFSSPNSALRRAPSSNIFLIQDDFSIELFIFSAIAMDPPLSLYIVKYIDVSLQEIKDKIFSKF
jgi:hypothetical protein